MIKATAIERPLTECGRVLTQREKTSREGEAQ
jgi:hypothetical protein